MFDEKLKRARQLIEKRDQIDEELRALFGELPSPKRIRRRMDKDKGLLELEKENGAAASGPSIKGPAASALGPKRGTNNRGMIIELDNPFKANIQRRPGANAPGGL